MSESTLIQLLVELAQRTLTVVTGGELTRNVYFVAFLDHFGVGSDQLTDEHKAVLDGWVAGSHTTGFPFRPGSSSQRLVMFAGLASQTGPESGNQQLGRKRAERVEAYLADRLNPSQVLDNIRSLGSTQPRPGFDQPGSEFAENRAVGVVLETQLPIIGVRTSPPVPPTQPPPPKSRDWSLSVHLQAGAGLDPVPGVNVLGAQGISGAIRNERVNQTKGFLIVSGGLDLSVGLSPPVELSMNFQGAQFTPFTTGLWHDFDDFDFSPVVISSASATDVVEWGSTAIGIYDVHAVVEPSGLTLKTAVGAGAQVQFGIMLLFDQ